MGTKVSTTVPKTESKITWHKAAKMPLHERLDSVMIGFKIYIPEPVWRIVADYIQEHRWAKEGPWKSPFVMVEANQVTAAMGQNIYIGAFGADSLSVSGSWCFQCDHPTGIGFGLALRDDVPDRLDSGFSDVCWSHSLVVFFYPSGTTVHGHGSKEGKDLERLREIRHTGPIRLCFNVCDDVLLLRVNDCGTFEIARKLGNLDRWTPYASFSPFAQRDVSVQLLNE